MMAALGQTSLNTIIQGGDASHETVDLRTEFYTREGLWRLVPNAEYARQPQSMYSSVQSTASGAQPMGAGNCNIQISSQEPVKLTYFKYFRFDEVLSATNLKKYRNLCIKCAQKKSTDINLKTSKPKSSDTSVNSSQNNNNQHQKVRFDSMREYDDDDDIIYKEENLSSDSDEYESDEVSQDHNNKHTHQNNNSEFSSVFSSSRHHLCKYCSMRVNKSNDTDLSIVNYNASGTLASEPSMDLVIFNYAREVYFYEMNDITAKIRNDKNLVDKKAYRTFITTCFDLNTAASMLNTVELQRRALDNSVASFSSPSKGHGYMESASSSVNLSPSHLSLIIAAGFNKGEVHVFDGFKKEASVFYNNNRLIEKTKVTCIKWLPNSMNLFLAGHSSGCIYLYDATNQAQPTVAPIFNKLYQDDSFSIHLNQHASTSPQINIIAESIGSTSTGSSSSRGSKQSQSSQTSLTQSSSRKLYLSSANQQPTQVAKNPLLKWTIGASVDSSKPDGLSSTFSNINSAGVNGVNEFAFSPCGSYLAIVTQDGYLRVFSFAYANNCQLQIQLICSMKSYFGGLLCCCWSADGRYIATGGEDDFITVFSFLEQRVACRGRGHNSWVNACTFDEWTCLGGKLNTSSNMSKSRTGNRRSDKTYDFDNEQRGDSDLENLATNESELKNLNLNQESIKSPTVSSSPQSTTQTKRTQITKKNRTISTLSDFNYSNLDQNNINGSSVYYRLASCGQDNQICFWDLTEDVLKEKAANSNRARLTSFNKTQSTSQKSKNMVAADLPQIVNQANDSSSKLTDVTKIKSGTYGGSHSKGSHSSLVSTARNLFSLKHSEMGKSKSAGKNKAEYSLSEQNEMDQTHKSLTNASSSSSFFKKHKRNSSLNTNQNAEVSKTKSSQQQQITLNSYTKKSANNTIGSLSMSPSDSPTNTNNNSSTQSNQSYNRSYTDSGVNSMRNSGVKGERLTGTGSFNISPKLDEVPMIEPLICKRVAKERLTDIRFKEDGFLAATQDGYVYTWVRPAKT